MWCVQRFNRSLFVCKWFPEVQKVDLDFVSVVVWIINVISAKWKINQNKEDSGEIFFLCLKINTPLKIPPSIYIFFCCKMFTSVSFNNTFGLSGVWNSFLRQQRQNVLNSPQHTYTPCLFVYILNYSFCRLSLQSRMFLVSSAKNELPNPDVKFDERTYLTFDLYLINDRANCVLLPCTINYAIM